MLNLMENISVQTRKYQKCRPTISVAWYAFLSWFFVLFPYILLRFFLHGLLFHIYK
jgi:hypothetical protein